MYIYCYLFSSQVCPQRGYLYCRSTDDIWGACLLAPHRLKGQHVEVFSQSFFSSRFSLSCLSIYILHIYCHLSHFLFLSLSISLSISLSLRLSHFLVFSFSRTLSLSPFSRSFFLSYFLSFTPTLSLSHSHK